MTIESGQVYRVDLGMAGKIRMMVVVSLSDANAPRALHVCVPLTTAYRDSWYEIPIGKKPFLREATYANVQGLQAVQTHELEGPIGKLHPAEMAGVRSALARMLEIG